MLKAEFLDKVLSGEKTITIRRWTNLKPGDVIFIHSGGKIRAKAVVKKVYKKSLGEIGWEEAKKEGMSLKELRDWLKKQYGEGPFYIIEFKVIEKYDEPIDPEELVYGGYHPLKIASLALKHRVLDSIEEVRILRKLLRRGSIRKAALDLGGLDKRKIIRKVLRKAYERLKERGVLK